MVNNQSHAAHLCTSHAKPWYMTPPWKRQMRTSLEYNRAKLGKSGVMRGHLLLCMQPSECSVDLWAMLHEGEAIHPFACVAHCWSMVDKLFFIFHVLTPLAINVFQGMFHNMNTCNGRQYLHDNTRTATNNTTIFFISLPPDSSIEIKC